MSRVKYSGELLGAGCARGHGEGLVGGRGGVVL